MPKKSVSRREVLKKAGAITASTFGASFALAGEPEKAPGTSAEATVSTDGGKAIGSELSPEQQALEKLWKEHLASEFKAKSAEAAVNTMVERLSVNHVPVMTGGVGRKQLTHFYGNYFIPQMPPDTEIIPISRTIGHDRLVDESSSSSPIPCKWIGCSLELPQQINRSRS